MLSLWRDPLLDSTLAWLNSSQPDVKRSFAFDIREDVEGIKLFADMPGVGNDDIEIEVEDGVLRIEGKRSDTHVYSRSFTVPQSIDREKITATTKLGVLTVYLPKKEVTRPRQIKVRSG